MAYQRTRWQNGSAGQTPINAARLNNIEDFNVETDVRLDSLETTVSGLGAGPTQEAPTWQTLAGKPVVVAGGADPAAARAAIGAASTSEVAAVAATAATKSEVTAALAGKAAAMPGSNLVMGGHFQTIAQMEAAYPLAAIPEGVVILCSTEED